MDSGLEQARTSGPCVVAQLEDPDSQGWVAKPKDLGPLPGSLLGDSGVV